jgi:predicted ATPase
MPEPENGIARITVKGFKSLAEECSIEIRPLTILAGANSSGKSSIMQPLLLMKQTLESPYNSGALNLNGENIKFTSVSQLLSKYSGNIEQNCFSVIISLVNDYTCKLKFQNTSDKGLKNIESIYQKLKEPPTILTPKMTSVEILQAIPKQISDSLNSTMSFFEITEFFCFLIGIDSLSRFPVFTPLPNFSHEIVSTIHVKGIRGNLERTYRLFMINNNQSHYPGAFENYTGSLITFWSKNDECKIASLKKNLSYLKLAEKLDVAKIDDTQIELKVNRAESSDDMVNIADVGSGVSQVLPVLVALVAAEPGQLVYLEEPEIHLHPRAQADLGEIIVEAANRGVRVVLETHSDLLLRRIQSLVAEDKISPDKAILHWFSRDNNGFTKITSSGLTNTGGYKQSDFPLDFSDVFLDEEGRYLDSASEKRWKENNGD